MKKEAIIQKVAQELLEQLGLDSSVVVSQEEEVFSVALNLNNVSDNPLLIGYHGEALFSFQLILSQLVAREIGEWVRITVEVGDYREKRKQQLVEMAENYAKRALESGQAVYLPPLSSSDRRIIHLVIQERTDVESVSEGEGNNRRLLIRPK